MLLASPTQTKKFVSSTKLYILSHPYRCCIETAKYLELAGWHAMAKVSGNAREREK
jgi:hypothetical protein